ncbi:sulfurtransferase complex subunit TusB [Parahaliea maris]|uniref:Sulfurtransferase complex subunit TusB n=1 Tax=Parahaliea maris TaxID=2716870 RepID=A0A5C8ZZU0_9GAMM|nr:sulfurtransferase complex subunit TusB [Parahaliea maris]TXS93040.1 sulfurtransferase complex subunit TusB [Parahaliea maris]
MILHTLNAAPEQGVFQQCLGQLGTTDALLLMGNGVYAALDGSPAATRLLATGATLYVLQDDARAAGVLPRLCPGVKAVDYATFVELTEQFPRQLAWY